MKSILLFTITFLCLTAAAQDETIPDQWDPADDSQQGATVLPNPISPGITHGPHTLSPDDEADWFVVALEAGVTYKFETLGESDTIGDLFLPNGNVRVASNQGFFDNPNFQIIFTPETGGNYLLRVTLFVPTSLPGPGGFPGIADQGEYTLSYRSGNIEIPPRDPWDPADDIFEGAPVLDPPTGNEMTHGPHTLADLDQADWFSFFLEEGFTYRFYSTGEAVTQALMFASDGETQVVGVDSPSSGDAFDIEFTPPDSAKYLLKVQQLRSGVNQYTLHYQLTASPPEPVLDQWDPTDDNRNGATPLGTPGIAEETHGPHTLALNDQSDWFAFQLEGGVEYEFRSSGGMDTLAVIHNANGNRLAEQDDGGSANNFRLRFTPTSTGAYLLQVRGFNPGASGSYTLHYRSAVELSGPDEWDPTDDTATGATRLPSISTSETTHGPHSLSETDTADWFILQLAAGIDYEIRTSGDTDTVGTLFQADGTTEVASNDDLGSNRNFHLRVNLEQSGSYRLRVTSINNEGGTYTLLYRGASEPDLTQPFILEQFPLTGINEFTEIPGGFDDFSSGSVAIGNIPQDTPFGDGQDGIGATLRTAPGQVELLMFPVVQTNGNPVIIQAGVRTSGPGAALTLAALGSQADSSIATDAMMESAFFESQYKNLILFYDPPADLVIPIVQLANLPGSETVEAWLDHVTVYAIPQQGAAPIALFEREPAEPLNTSSVVPTPSSTGNFNTTSEFTRMPGGFINEQPGFLQLGPYPEEFFGPLTSDEQRLTDGTGITLTLEPDTLELLLMPEVPANGRPVLIRAAVKSNAPGAQVALGALDSAGDGSIATVIPANSVVLSNELQWMTLVFTPTGPAVSPVFQVSNLNGSQEVKIFLDTVETYILPENEDIQSDFLHGF